MILAEIKLQLSKWLTTEPELPIQELTAITKILNSDNMLLHRRMEHLFGKVDDSFDVKYLTESILPKSFCSYPFKSLSLEPNGSGKPCCKFNTTSGSWHDTKIKNPINNIDEIFNQNYIESLRLDFLSGVKPTSCHTCWLEEELGIPSMRQRMPLLNKWDQSMPWYSLLRVIDIDTPKSIELKLSNICNLKCRSCNGYLSSRWIDEEESLMISTQERILEYKENSREKFVANPTNLQILRGWAKNLNSIQFYGGEPLLQSEHDHILEELVRTGYSKNISISYCSNGTICRDNHFELWTKFKNVWLNFSLDAVGPRAEYIRHPCKWSEIERNINKFIQNKKLFNVNIQYEIVTTVSILNVLYLDEIVNWASNTGLKIELNLVHYPNYLSIKNTSDKFKEYASERLRRAPLSNYSFVKNGPDIETLIGYMNEPADYTQKEMFSNRIMISDGYRNESFAKTFPELYEIIK